MIGGRPRVFSEQGIPACDGSEQKAARKLLTAAAWPAIILTIRPEHGLASSATIMTPSLCVCAHAYPACCVCVRSCTCLVFAFVLVCVDACASAEMARAGAVVLVALAFCSTVCHAGFTVNAVGAPSRSLAWTPTLDVLPSHLSVYQKV